MSGKTDAEMETFGSLAFECIHSIRKHSMHMFTNYNLKSLMLSVYVSTPSYSGEVSVDV